MNQKKILYFNFFAPLALWIWCPSYCQTFCIIKWFLPSLLWLVQLAQSWKTQIHEWVLYLWAICFREKTGQNSISNGINSLFSQSTVVQDHSELAREWILSPSNQVSYMTFSCPSPFFISVCFDWFFLWGLSLNLFPNIPWIYTKVYIPVTNQVHLNLPVKERWIHKNVITSSLKNGPKYLPSLKAEFLCDKLL